MTGMMKAAVFVERGRIVLEDKKIPDAGPNDALMRFANQRDGVLKVAISTALLHKSREGFIS